MTGTMPMTATMPMTGTMPMTPTMPMTGTMPSAPAQAASAGGYAPQTAEAGAVTVTLTPRNLADPAAQTLDFDVALNTHSVDLSGDLAKLATLRAGSKQVAASTWAAPAGGGHHVAGLLSFPAVDAKGQPLLEGANTVVVRIRNLAGVPLRTFTWKLGQ